MGHQPTRMSIGRGGRWVSIPARMAVLGVIAATAAGCSMTAQTDFDYARTTLGYRNSGLLSEGRVYFWDSGANDLTYLGDSVSLDVLNSVGPQDMTARRVRDFNVTVSGAPNAAIASKVEADVKTYLGNEMAFVVKNAVRRNSADPRGKLHQKYREIQPDDGYYRWRIAKLVNAPSRYKLVVITDPVYASSETISVSGKAGGTVKLKVPSVASGDVTVDLKSSSEASCTGTNALCFFNVFVAEAGLAEEGGEKVLRLRAADVDNASRTQLTEAFRKLI